VSSDCGVIEIDTESTVVVAEQATDVVDHGPEAIDVLHVAQQGPRGPQGVPGPAGGATLVPVGPDPISGHSAVAVNADGALVYADCTDVSHLGAVLGVVAAAYMAGDDAVVQTAYPLAHVGWAWAPNQPVYLGTAGQLTQVLPAGAVFCQVVGWALADTTVLIDLQPPILIS
jgi:hypothetical protein